jgi:pimeloyl-ACP methyl ester carboxylesterase
MAIAPLPEPLTPDLPDVPGVRHLLVDVGEVRLHVAEAGEGDPIVLQHGWPQHWYAWRHVIPTLARTRRVIAPDLRGFGWSEAPPGRYEKATFASDLIGLLDALDLDRVVMGGHSFGGLLTYWLAANHPERVERCVVLDAPAGVSATIMQQIQPSLARLGHVHPSWDDYLAAIEGMPYFADGGWDADVESYYRADAHSLPDGTVQARSRPEHIREAVELSAGIDWADVAGRVMQPTLLLRAPGSFGPPGFPPLLSRSDAEATVSLMADGRLVDGVGNHITFVFGPGAQILTGAIAAFLAGEPS